MRELIYRWANCHDIGMWANCHVMRGRIASNKIDWAVGLDELSCVGELSSGRIDRDIKVDVK